MKKNILLGLILLFGAIVTANAQACGGIFTDPAGANANYDNNSNYTVTICPSVPGEVVTVTFTEFNMEATFDALYVYNGNSTSSPQISSGNQAGNVPGGIAGGFWGATIPEPITSTSPDGCLTFVFRSDGSVSLPGWTANVTCAPPPTCPRPSNLSVSSITHTSAQFGWTETGFATAWDIYLAPAGSPMPIDATMPTFTASSIPSSYTGLTPNTCYTFYVRAACSGTDNSTWAGGYNFCTLPAPPGCGGQFTDAAGPNANYAANSNITTVICPNNPGDVVTVTFTSFNTEATWDALYVFDGNSATAPQIPSNNGQGNVPGGIAGGYWGNTIPGPFMASSPNGCLTFLFRSDASVQNPGWIANVTCAPPPNCLAPSNLTINSTTTTSVVLGWTDNSTVSSWEVLALPAGSPLPTATDSGQVVTTNPATISGLATATAYDFYVRANCDQGDHSYWSLRKSGATAISNDECVTAIDVPISGRMCTQTIHGSLTGATASTDAFTCTGSADDDAWFKFVATAANLNVTLNNVSNALTNPNIVVYSGSCGSLTSIFCGSGTTSYASLSNLTIGATYYVRVFSNGTAPVSVTFDVCITIPSTCLTGESICGANNYANTTGVPSLGTIGCLSTTPNPTFFTLRIAASGTINLLLTQSSIGSATANLDVDYAAWGPFTSQDAGCTAVSSGQAPGIGAPGSQTTGCSYSPNPTETLSISNAVAGEYYIILITNFSNQPGYISVTQTNTNAAGAGSIDCSGIRLNAFLDSNSNGTQDNGEPNFPLGQFHYDINNSGNPHAITSATGTHMIYDYNPANLYNLSYTINNDYASQYNTSASYSNVSVASGGLITYDFPVTISQNYNDAGVTIVPQGTPRAGFSYNLKVIYTNNGTQAIPSGTLTFNNNVGTTITNVSQTGTTVIPNGFTYVFSNLLPYETRSMIVTIAVPSIPAVFLGQLLTNTIAVTPPTGDTVSNNNTSSCTQAVTGSYDPNDKLEGHGEKIVFSTFTSDDYLEYTIRFENTGTAGALDVVVNDILDNKLDENTLVMLAASHSYYLDRLGNNLSWKFSNIQLPVSVPDTEIGKGFVKFKIKPKPGYEIGDIIPNTADIIFDSNPAIVTNTFNTEFVATLGNELFTENSIVLYPNPAKNTLYINLQNSTEIIDEVVIFDVLGKNVARVSKVSSNQSVIDVSELSKGIYMVEITTENHLKQVKKLIVQ